MCLPFRMQRVSPRKVAVLRGDRERQGRSLQQLELREIVQHCLDASRGHVSILGVDCFQETFVARLQREMAFRMMNLAETFL